MDFQVLEKINQNKSLQIKIKDSISSSSIHFASGSCRPEETRALLNQIKENSLRVMSCAEEITPMEREFIWGKIERLVMSVLGTRIGRRVFRFLPRETSIACADLDGVRGNVRSAKAVIILSPRVLNNFKAEAESEGQQRRNVCTVLHEMTHLYHYKVLAKSSIKGYTFYDLCFYRILDEIMAHLIGLEFRYEKGEIKDKNKFYKLILQEIKEVLTDPDYRDDFYRFFENDYQTHVSEKTHFKCTHSPGFHYMYRCFVRLHPELGKMKVSRLIKRHIRQMYLEFLGEYQKSLPKASASQ